MGLSMYVYKTKIPPTTKTNGRDHPHVNEEYFDFDWEYVPAEIKAKHYDSSEDIELYYWRKHPDLHRWFENLYREHGGKEYEHFDYEKYAFATLEEYHAAIRKYCREEEKIDCIYPDCGYPPCAKAICIADEEEEVDDEEEEVEGLGDSCDMGEPIYFNGNSLELDSVDIAKLSIAIVAKTLPSNTGGFMFGTSWGDDQQRAYDMEFIRQARIALYEGFFLYYISSW